MINVNPLHQAVVSSNRHNVKEPIKISSTRLIITGHHLAWKTTTQDSTRRRGNFYKFDISHITYEQLTKGQKCFPKILLDQVQRGEFL